jgi:HEXXH motif-containing protein
MLADDIQTALERSTSGLDGQLASIVAPVGWRWLRAIGIDKENYGTLRALTGNRTASRTHLAMLPLHSGNGSIAVERLGTELPVRYSELGLRECDLPAVRLEQALRSGLDALALVPEATLAVRTLVRSVHCLAVEDPDFDVSYSDPEVPFSIFVGVHGERTRQEALRAAEAILHETMHLQLSLAEVVVPLVVGSEERWNSPWQGRPRPVQGVLHGLYVFRVIEDFLERYTASSTPDTESRAYISERLKSIDKEIAGLRDLQSSTELTEAGRVLVGRLVDRNADR